MAALKSTPAFRGRLNDKVKLGKDGERDTPYFLWNFVGARWIKAGSWNTHTRNIAIDGPIPGCECIGRADEKGQGAKCGEFCDEATGRCDTASWCYVNASCRDKNVAFSAAGWPKLVGCKYGITYSDGSHIRPPSTSLVNVLVLLPFSGGWTGGKWMSPAIEGAFEMMRNSTFFMPGMRFAYKTKNSQCSAGNAMADVVDYLKEGANPQLVFGPACSGVALQMQPVAANLKLPLLSSGALNSQLTDKAYFIRTVTPTSSGIAWAADMARATGLTSVGAVASTQFTYTCIVFPQTIASRNMSSTCGCLLVDPARTSVADVNRLTGTGCRLFAMPGMYHQAGTWLGKLGSNLFMPGVGIAAGYQNVASLLPESTVVGWLVLIPQVNKTSESYKRMLRGFNKYWYQDHLKGYNKEPTSAPTLYTEHAWNMAIAAGHVLTLLMKNSGAGNPPMYPDNPNFATNFMHTLKHWSGPGAGKTIEFNRNDGMGINVVNEVLSRKGGEGGPHHSTEPA